MWLLHVFFILGSACIVLTQNGTTIVGRENNEETLKLAADIDFPRLKYCVDDAGEKLFGTIKLKTDCRKFVYCGYASEQIMSCQRGLLFNDVQKWCDWPRSANCIDFPAKDKSKLVIPADRISW